MRAFHTVSEKPYEKGLEQRFERRFGSYEESEIGKKCFSAVCRATP